MTQNSTPTSNTDAVQSPDNQAVDEQTQSTEQVVVSTDEVLAGPDGAAKSGGGCCGGDKTETSAEGKTDGGCCGGDKTEAKKPSAPSPAALAKAARPHPPTTGVAAPTPVSPQEPSTDELAARGRQWGRVDDEGSVYVTTSEGERCVGSYPAGTHDEALAYFVRKYDDIDAQMTLVETRLALPDTHPKDLARAAEAVKALLPEAKAVGDLDGIQRRLDAAGELIEARRKEAEVQRAEAKKAATAVRTALVEEAETISNTPAERMQWRANSERIRTLFDEWKEAQKNGPRLDRPVEDELWKRFSHARTVFERLRRHHMADLEKRHTAVKTAKEALIAEAEKLSVSTDWAKTSTTFRTLMDQWKAAGRAGRKDEEALWKRFRAAQDVFFAARSEHNEITDKEYAANLVVKEELLTEAEALLPISDINAAKRALRGIQERWEAAGKVPRADVSRVERRMRAVEEAIRGAEQEKWKRSNPETKARAEGALGQLEAAITKLETELEKAQASGNAKRAKEAQEALDARRAWLEQVRKAAADFSG